MLKWKNILKFPSLLPKSKFLRHIHRYDFKRPVNYPKRDFIKLKTEDEKTTALGFSKSNTFNDNSKKRDYYAILDVEKNATIHEIKKNYYVLAKKFHPDASQGTESSIGAKKFQEISEAYHVLSDENKRMEYDLYGTVKDVGSYLRTLTARNSKATAANLNQIMKDYKLRKESIKYDTPSAVHIPDEVDLTLTFLQAVQGATKDINVKVMSPCKKCGGILSRQRKSLEMCKVCNGTGRSVTTIRNYFVKGFCKACKGTRYSSRHECTACNNTGLIATHSRFSLKIPPGVNSGDILKLPHPDGQQTVNVRIKVMKSKHFNRTGNDILTEKFLTISEAILGGVFKIKGIYEDLEVRLPEGIESHTKVKIPGKGVKSNSGVGDHIVLFKIKIPRNLSIKQKELVSVLSKIEHPIRDNLDNTNGPYV